MQRSIVQRKDLNLEFRRNRWRDAIKSGPTISLSCETGNIGVSQGSEATWKFPTSVSISMRMKFISRHRIYSGVLPHLSICSLLYE